MMNLDLLNRISTGDRDAFVQLMEAYGPGLYSRLLEKLGDRSLADAAFREIMLDFHRKLSGKGEKDAVAALLADEADAVIQRILLDSMEELIDRTAEEAFSVELCPEPVPCDWPTLSELPEEPAEKPGFIWWTAVVLLIVCALMLCWVVIGLLVSMEVLPRLDLGYSWFDANIAEWFELQ